VKELWEKVQEGILKLSKHKEPKRFTITDMWEDTSADHELWVKSFGEETSEES
jgi:hypothetical protein